MQLCLIQLESRIHKVAYKAVSLSICLSVRLTRAYLKNKQEAQLSVTNRRRYVVEKKWEHSLKGRNGGYFLCPVSAIPVPACDRRTGAKMAAFSTF